MWKLILPTLVMGALFGCDAHKEKEFTIHGRLKEINQHITHRSCEITIKFEENGTEIYLVSDGDPISGDFTDQEVVLTYTKDAWNNHLVKLEKIDEFAKRKYEQITEDK